MRSITNEAGERIIAGEDIVIEAYGENGEHCDKPFFRVKRAGAVVRRIPATMVEVEYDTSVRDEAAHG